MVGNLFFFFPALAFLVGVRPAAIENRKMADFPQLSSGWSFFSGFDRWAIDHLPLRDIAVQANTDISERVFHEVPDYTGRRESKGAAAAFISPMPAQPVPPDAASGTSEEAGPGEADYPAVLSGKQGWLYFGDDVKLACWPSRDLESIFAGWRELISTIEASGRRVVVTIAPDKSTIMPQYLPDTYAGQQCSAARRAQLWDRLNRGDLGPAYVDLRGPLERQSTSGNEPIYWPGDTHWSPRAETIYAQEVVARLAPELVDSRDVLPAPPVTRIGDLTRILGSRRSETTSGWQIQRRGVSPTWWQQPADVLTGRHISTTTGPALITEKVALIGDSFSYMSLRQLVPYFADLTLVSRKDASFEQKARAIRQAQTVIVQVVERRFTTGTAVMIDSEFLDRLAHELQTP